MQFTVEVQKKGIRETQRSEVRVFFVPDGHKSTRLARIIFKILIAFIELGKIQARLVPGLNFAF